MDRTSSTPAARRGLRMNPIVDVAQLRARYALTMALALAGGFLVVATYGFATGTVAALGFAIGIGIVVVSGGLALLHGSKAGRMQPIGRRAGQVRVPVWLTLAGVTGALGVWQIVQTLVFSAGTSRWLTFADALGLVVAALAGLAVHELSTERVVHSLEVIGESGGSDGEHAESRRHAVEA